MTDVALSLDAVSQFPRSDDSTGTLSAELVGSHGQRISPHTGVATPYYAAEREVARAVGTAVETSSLSGIDSFLPQNADALEVCISAWNARVLLDVNPRSVWEPWRIVLDAFVGSSLRIRMGERGDERQAVQPRAASAERVTVGSETMSLQPSERGLALMRRAKEAASSTVEGHLNAGREVYGRRHGKPVVIKPSK